MIQLLGAFLYRYRGMSHDWKYTKFILKLAFSLPYASYVYFNTWNPYMAVAVWALTFAAVSTGHGRFISLEKLYLEGKPERIEFMTSWLIPYMPVYWYKILGLSLTGLLVSLPAGVCTLNPFIALSGLLKGACYALSEKTDARTEGGELLTGAVLWSFLCP